MSRESPRSRGPPTHLALNAAAGAAAASAADGGASYVQRLLQDAAPQSGNAAAAAGYGVGGGYGGGGWLGDPPTESDAQCEAAAAGIIAACQAGGLCDVAMRGVTRLPPALLRFFRAEGSLVLELQLQGNRLGSAPPLELLPSLTRLDLSANLLESLPDSLGCLTRLRSLDVSRNGALSALPEALCQLTALTSLDASHNVLECLPLRMERLVRLVELRLDRNRLAYLPAAAAGLPSLTALHVSHNRLTALPSELGGAFSLTAIFAGHNLLTAVPASIGSLHQRLAELQLHNNHLAVLPAELGRLLALTRLTSGCNPLVHPPRAVAARGVAAVREYLLAAQREAAEAVAGAGTLPAEGEDATGARAGVEDHGASREGSDGGEPCAESDGAAFKTRQRPLHIGSACVACADKDDRIEELGQLLREARERCGQLDKQLEHCREQLARQAKDLAAQAARATFSDGEISRLTRQLAAASLLPGYRGPPVPAPPSPHEQQQQPSPRNEAVRAPAATPSATGRTAGRGPETAAELEAHLQAELREARQAASVAQAEAEERAREAMKQHKRAELAESEVAALREAATVAADNFRRERERCDAATLAATEAERMAADLLPVVAERDSLRKQLQVAKAAGDEAWRAVAAARDGHHTAEAAADMVQGRLVAAEAVNRAVKEQLEAERRAAAAAAAAAESRERQLQVELERVRADLAALHAERELLREGPRASQSVVSTSSGAHLHVASFPQSTWFQPQAP
ncbi:hypothetical protein GPECTOR_14g182 [Gonium pectorale]|uniref:Uncharacterized protein n=1 Tax=Gonium pectorale TaxID=33097 RepID=A0A150GMA9_GONPE|nr:hypothetical protein GPECTOR_14g182 [Gonium pectorale]|eukprot:KXZ50937.1 hypothetical protein GPECTOR_14g182 [Gonium pectorale]